MKKKMIKTESVELLKKKKPPEPKKCEYELRSVVCDYGIYRNGKLILILNDYTNARYILDILKYDEQKKRYPNMVMMR